MANRTYLYAERPREDGTTQLIDVAECASDVPLAYQLLCSINTERVPSKIVDDTATDEETGETLSPLAIRASFTAGREALFRFMERFAEVNSKNLHLPEDSVAEEFASTRNELLDERFAGCTHFWMEPFEVYSLVADSFSDFSARAEATFRDTIAAEDRTTSILDIWESGDFDEHGSAQELFYSLGFGTWSKILYFHFPDDSEK
ncbi:hypothetical protein [Corynebacterium sp.]|uniref:DUF7822 domain-containing protein n=1 Tax=Corynebacterium sp. TaxID=1720 RepID=UPI0026DB230B|nr:hypothetical protein [Corynebacterium sp.]MDO5076306.1 hypothetical protein [Corynebacterium sp.]